MAIRRAKQKAQVVEKLSQVAPPGETFIACVHVETGPSPWLNALFDEVPLLGLIVALTRKFYFLTLTNSSVVVNSASRWTNRPGEVVAVFPRAAFPVTRVKRATIWSSIYLQFPGESSPRRLNIHRYWRDELDQLSVAFPGAGAAGQIPGQVPGYPAPAQPQGYAAPAPGYPAPAQPQGYAAPGQAPAAAYPVQGYPAPGQPAPGQQQGQY
ncbi:hypothetical protein GCM10009665_65610 [Kitasatospora nipponensis]|uniref:PH (Pleckstrin Homology) domain-containing protein n=1 Tax=Kitasatospora nipponensis TaxID=258049 RepID=A0ABP4HI51_9ACTN